MEDRTGLKGTSFSAGEFAVLSFPIGKKNSAVGGWRSLPAVNQREFEVFSHSLMIVLSTSPATSVSSEVVYFVFGRKEMVQFF